MMSYTISLYVFAMLSVLSIVAALAAREPEKWRLSDPG